MVQTQLKLLRGNERMLCDMNSKTQSITLHCSSPGVTWGPPLSTEGRNGGHGLQTSARNISRFALQAVTGWAGSQEPPSHPVRSVLLPPVPSCPIRATPDLSWQGSLQGKGGTEGDKETLIPASERIKVNLLTADNISLPESSPSSEELHSQLYNNPPSLALGT